MLPPNPRWDVTDFGLGDWRKFGLVLVNLAEEPEYCEKLMYARRGMVTPAHAHAVKKEDIIARAGSLRVRVWASPALDSEPVSVKVCGERQVVTGGTDLILRPGERVTLVPGVVHEFEAESEEVVIGEVSTANDDATDNLFVRTDVGRFPGIDEDAPVGVRLVSEA